MVKILDTAVIAMELLCQFSGIRAEDRSDVTADTPNVEVSREHDEQGRLYLRGSVKSVKLEIPGDICELLPSPEGKFVYGIGNNNASVKVYELPSFKELDAVTVPRCPVSIWCDHKHIVVACDESRVIQILDAATRKPLKAVTLADQPKLSPYCIAGKGSDGLMTLWEPEGASLFDRGRNASIYQVNEKGEAQSLFGPAGMAYSDGSTIEWCSLTNSGPRLFLQCTGKDGRWVPRMLDLTTGKPDNALLTKLFGSHGYKREFGRCFVTADGHLAMPTHRIDDYTAHSPDWTYVATMDMNSIAVDVPGIVISESENCLISCTQYCSGMPGITALCISNPATPPFKQQAACGKTTIAISYADRTTGRTLRIIEINGADPARSAFFVPAHELFVYRDDNSFNAVRCGPVKITAHARGIAVSNEPPYTIRAGQRFSFVPDLVKQDLTLNAYRLKSAPRGMTIDSHTGVLDWAPEDAHIGKWDVSIVANAEGKELPVLSWVLEVRP
jgi:hypothetical protein